MLDFGQKGEYMSLPEFYFICDARIELVGPCKVKVTIRGAAAAKLGFCSKAFYFSFL